MKTNARSKTLQRKEDDTGAEWWEETLTFSDEKTAREFHDSVDLMEPAKVPPLHDSGFFKSTVAYGATMCLMLLAFNAGAITIPIDLGPQQRVIGDERINFSDLNGTGLNGQSMSIDYQFSNNEFARMLPETYSSFIFLVIFQTNATGFLNEPTGSGFITDQFGHSLLGASTSGGSVSGGPDELLRILGGALFPLADDNGNPRTDITRPFDFYGAHFDLALPSDPGFEITGAQILLSPDGSNRSNNTWVVGPHVPEEGNAIVLMATSLLVLFLLNRAWLGKW